MQTSFELWPLAAYIALVVALVAVLLTLSYLLGPKTRDRNTGEIYESGVLPIGPAHVRFDAKFYLIAMFFLIFDLEAVFIYAWAVCLRESGWTGWGEMMVFIAVLVVALMYLWRSGALDWAPNSAAMAHQRQQRTRHIVPPNTVRPTSTANTEDRKLALDTEQIR